MKYIVIFLFSIAINSTTIGQGINFFHGTWEEAKELAAAEQKLIFVDAYAKWCGPCKRMAKTVFTQAEVGDYFNENFINLKIDMEEGMGLTFRNDYPVRAYPTLMFIDEKGEMVKKVVGGKQKDDFLNLGKSIIASFDRSGDYAELYEKGDRSYDLVLNYIKALNQAGKPSLMIANDFIRNNKELSPAQNAMFLYEALLSADSRIFKMYTENMDDIIAAVGNEKAKAKIEKACWVTIDNAIEFESEELLAEAQTKMNLHHPTASNAFRMNADLKFARATNNIPKLSNTTLEMSKTVYKDDHAQQMALAEELMLYQALYPEVADTAEEIVSKVVKKNKQPEYRLLYAKILLANNKSKKALKEAEKAYKDSDKSDRCAGDLEELIRTIKAG